MGSKVWVRKGELPYKMTTRAKQQVHVYAAISYNNKTELYFVSGTTGMKHGIGSKPTKGVGAAEYSELLTKKMLPACRLMF